MTLPALERGRAAGGSRTPWTDSPSPGPPSRASGAPTRSSAAAIRGTKEQIAFYASTPAYRGVLEHHGWGDLQPELTRMSKEGKWKEMADVIDDDVVRTFAAVGDVTDRRAQLRERWDVARRDCRSTSPYRADDAVRRELLAELSD